MFEYTEFPQGLGTVLDLIAEVIQSQKCFIGLHISPTNPSIEVCSAVLTSICLQWAPNANRHAELQVSRNEAREALTWYSEVHALVP